MWGNRMLFGWKKAGKLGKKAVILAALAVLALLAVPAQGASAAGPVPVKIWLGGQGTSLEHPVQTLGDRNLSTAWWSKVMAMPNVWAMAELDGFWAVEKARLYFSPEAAGEFRLEYEQNGVWFPFLGGTHILPSSSSPVEVDLSREGIVTRRIRVVAANPPTATAVGGLEEVEIFGSPVVPAARRVQVTQVTGDEVNPRFPVSFLTDGNTYTFWQAQVGGKAVFTLEQAVRLDRVKLFGPLPAGTVLAVEADNGDDAWQTVGTVTGDGTTAVWQALSIPGEVTARRVRLQVFSADGPVPIPEVEVWGFPANNGDIPAFAAPAGFRQGQWLLSVSRILGAQGIVAAAADIPGGAGSYRGARVVASLKGFTAKDGLVLLWNGEPVSFTLPAPAAERGGWAELVVEIPADRIQPGRNFVTLRTDGKDGGTVEDIRLVLLPRDGAVEIKGAAAPEDVAYPAASVLDGSAFTTWQTYNQGGEAALELDLGSRHAVDGVSFYLPELMPEQIRVEYLSGETWTPVPGGSRDAVTLTSGWNRIEFASAVEAAKIRLVFSAPGLPYLGGVGEVAVWGSPVNDGAPRITFLSPAASSVVEKRVTVIGTVDNVQCQVWVQGVPATLTDNIFTAEIALDAKGSKTVRAITAKAVDQSGQAGEASLPVYLLKKTPVITLQGPAEGWITTDDAVTVQGTLDDNGVDLAINGTQVRVQGRSFSYQLPLAEGLNVITVTAKDHFGNTSTEERLVIRDTLAPEVLVQTPFAGAVLNYFPVIVGSVSDLTGVQATVNGQTVPMAGGVFRVEGLTFAPGENVIAITVTDAMGNVTKINTSFIFDPTPPELLVAQPQNGQILNAQPIDVTGQIKDAYGANVLVNGLPSLIDGERFTATVPLTEGTNTLTTVAIDLAGQQAVDVRQVVLDTTPPDPFTPAADPASWAPVTIPVITFFTTDATSGVDHYEVSVDGGEWVTAASPYTLPALSDGIHAIKVKAVDRAGWSTEGTVDVYVDTTAPAAFVPVANPGDWTPDNTPTITFDTTDATSGVDHYEVAVNDGPWTVAASPYILPEQPDGEHLVKIRAIDKAGNIAEGTVKIYIDTTPPRKPEVVRVVPGPDRISVIWTASVDTDVVQYQVERNDPWSEGTRMVTSEVTEIRDENLGTGEVYEYRVIAIDRAGNAGIPTEWRSAEVGVGRAEFDPEQGSVVEYENVALVVPREALPADIEKIEVREIESPEIEEAAIFPIWSPIYDFTVTKKGAAEPEEGTTFETGILVKLTYDDSIVPPEFPEENLGVYYFDEMFGRWFRVSSVIGVDKDNNSIYFMTNHFTAYTVQPTIIKDLSPQEYKDMGFSPTKSYVKHDGVTVSPQNGTVSTSVTELVLPGQNGFEFVLNRNYDTATARMDALTLGVSVSMPIGIIAAASGVEIPTEIMEWIKTYQTLQAIKGYAETALDTLKKFQESQGDYALSMGQGWRLSLPAIRGGSDGLYLRLPDGSMHSLNEMKITGTQLIGLDGTSRNVTFEQHEGQDFIVKLVQDSEQVPFRMPFFFRGQAGVAGKTIVRYITSWKSKYYELWLRDGTYYQFDLNGRPVLMKDPTGTNTITFTYDGFKLTAIKDGMGREIRLDYTWTADWLRISKIYVVNDAPYNRTITYQHDPLFATLTQATDAGGRTAHYDYKQENLIAINAGGKLSIINAILAGVGYAIGGPLGAAIVEQLFPEVTLFAGVQIEMQMPMVELQAPGQGRVAVHYTQHGFTYSDLRWKYWWFIPVSATLTIEQENVLYPGQVNIFQAGPGGALVRSTRYDPDVERWGEPYIRQNTVTEGNRVTVYHYYAFQKKRTRWQEKKDPFFGVVTFSTQTSRIDTLTYNDWIEVKSVNPGQLLEKVNFTVDTNTMHPTKQVITKGNQLREITFEYDNWGNLTRQTDSGGNYNTHADDVEVITAYVNTNSQGKTVSGAHSNPYAYNVKPEIHNKPVAVIQLLRTPVGAGGMVSDGTPVTLVAETYYQYNSVGQPVEERTWDATGQRWLVTKYEYNPAGHLARIIKPDNSVTLNEYNAYGFLVKTTSMEVADAQGVRQNIAKEFHYDPMTGWLLWSKNGRGYVTQYTYDSLGRIVLTTLPDDDDDPANNPTQGMSFNDSANDTVVTDPLHNKVKYDYDSLGRLVKVVKYARDGSEYAVTSLTYDGDGNITGITDPNGNLTRYEYDVKGNLTAIIFPDDTPTPDDNPRKVFRRNYAQNIVTVVDELGRSTVQTLDMNDRVVREQRTGSFAGDFTKVMVETAYDSRGNKVMVTDPRQLATISYYDNLNRLVQVWFPEDTFLENGQPVPGQPAVKYEYDVTGNKTAELKQLPNGTWHKTNYVYDSLGRLIRMTVPYTDQDGSAKAAVTETYYDGNGNKVKVVDPNNTGKPFSEQAYFQYTYSAQGWLLSETDPAGNKTSYTYDAAGNKLTMTDPRGNSTPVENDYTMWYGYDELYRLVKGILPDDTPQDLSDNPAVTLVYDQRGNNTKRIDPQKKETVNDYDARNRVIKTTVSGAGKSYTTAISYDAAGNKLSVTDARQQTIHYLYDDLNRLKTTVLPDQNRQQYAYDTVGNRTLMVDGRGNRASYAYNSQNKLIQVTDAQGHVTRYGYDRLGNLTYQEDAKGRATAFAYDELGRLLSSIDPLGYIRVYGYDANGNRITTLDPNGTTSTYAYSPNNLLLTLDLVGTDGRTQRVSYVYDAAGNRVFTGDGRVNLTTVYDPMGRVIAETRSLVEEGASYTTTYRYDAAGNLTGIKYPESSGWLEYQYNQMDEPMGISGYINTPPTYNAGGWLESLTTANGVTTSYGWDANGRLRTLNAAGPQGTVLSLSYDYDPAGNIMKRNNNTYAYDELNRLTSSKVEGVFQDDARGQTGYATGDYYGKNTLNFGLNMADEVALDYASSSLGVKTAQEGPGITRLYLRKAGSVTDRVTQGSMDLYVSSDNGTYNRLDNTKWQASRLEDGRLEVRFAEPQSGYVKVHNKFDDRNENLGFTDLGTFRNQVGEIGSVTTAEERLDWEYDAVGNRTSETETKLSPHTKVYRYYTNSDRLLTDGEYAFRYDRNGNLVVKGNNFSIAEATEEVIFTQTGEGVKYWEYGYDLMNRLIWVKKNGAIVADYTYDPAGFRIEARRTQGTTHYVPNLANEALYEKDLTQGKVRDYIWWNGKHLARAEGDPANAATIRYFYHLDHEGSLMAATDQSGMVVWQKDYLPFGEGIEQENPSAFAEEYGFTGKAYEAETGLYYYNARWYDPDLGRFTTADEWPVDVNNPMTLNAYTYALDNPLVYVDPTGHAADTVAGIVDGGPSVTFTFSWGPIQVDLPYGLLKMLFDKQEKPKQDKEEISEQTQEIQANGGDLQPEIRNALLEGNDPANAARDSLFQFGQDESDLQLAAEISPEEDQATSMINYIVHQFFWEQPVPLGGFEGQNITSEVKKQRTILELGYVNKAHYGTDIAAPIGTPVKASVGGKVVFAGQSLGFGNVVAIEIGNIAPGLKVAVLYGHLSEINFDVGNSVGPKDIVALSGNTGIGTGPHLHAEYRVYVEGGNPLSLRDKVGVINPLYGCFIPRPPFSQDIIFKGVGEI